MQDHRLTKL